MGLLIEKNSRNMVSRHTNGRDVAIEFQALGIRWARRPGFMRDRYADKVRHVSVKSKVHYSELGHAI
jgi:hypothetical protein